MKTRKLILCGLFTALMIVGAFVKIPFPGMPMTFQFAFALLAGIILGPCWGTCAVALYALLGLIGLPVFSAGGGLGYVLTPSFGYILGFIAAAFVAGLIAKSSPNAFPRLITASLVALTITYFVGMVYFTLIKIFYLGEDVSLWYLVYSQVILMLPKDILLCFLCSFIGKRLQFIIAMDRFR